MAVKGSASITLTSIVDVAGTARWYLLQSSTLNPPAKPTASPPGGSWASTEPTYAEGSTNSLYFCDLTVFSDGTWSYSAVSLSSSYEAAKAAYNKAVAAANAARALNAVIRDTAEGVEVAKVEDGEYVGTRTLATAEGFKVIDAAGREVTMSMDAAQMVLASLLDRICVKSINGLEVLSTIGDDDGEHHSILQIIQATASQGVTDIVTDGTALSITSGALGDQPLRLNGSVVKVNGGTAYGETLLFCNLSAPLSGATTLSQSAANFKRLKIWYRTDDSHYGYTETPGDNPNGQVLDLTCNVLARDPQGNAAMWIKAKAVYISGNSINTHYTQTSNYWCGSVGSTNWQAAVGDYIGIVQVAGIK